MPPSHPAGLCCAALLARYGFGVTVVESHYHAGGAAHAFEVQGYSFDAGPSFFAGLSGGLRVVLPCARFADDIEADLRTLLQVATVDFPQLV